jgi:hypothetical protein
MPGTVEGVVMRAWGTVGAFRLLAVLGTGLAAGSCSAEPVLERSDPGETGDAGTFEGRLALTLPTGSGVTAVDYEVSSGLGERIAAGSVDVSDANPTTSITLTLAPGSGDVVSLTGVTSAGGRCAGASAPFNVVEQQAVSLNVTLVCRAPDSGDGGGD